MATANKTVMFDHQEIPGWCDFEDIYAEMVARAPEREQSHFVEVGVYLGRSACAMGMFIQRASKPILFDAIDHFDDTGLDLPEDHQATIALYGNREAACRHFLRRAGVESVVNLFAMPSVVAAARYLEHSLDFVWIDANHKREVIAVDLLAWWPKVKPGGRMGGHDYWPYRVHPDSGVTSDVRPAVDEFFGVESEALAYGATSWMRWKQNQP